MTQVVNTNHLVTTRVYDPPNNNYNEEDPENSPNTGAEN